MVRDARPDKPDQFGAIADRTFRHRQMEQHLVFGHRRQKGVIQCHPGFVRLGVDELATHAVPDRHISDRFGPGQHLEGQIFTAALRQPRRRASASIHFRTTTKKSGWHPSCRRQPGGACNPALNHARERMRNVYNLLLLHTPRSRFSPRSGSSRRNIWSEAQALQCPQRAHTDYVRPNGHPRSLPAPSPRWATHHPRLRGRANVSLQDKVRDFAGPRRSGARWLC
jgi:hypothetical protein